MLGSFRESKEALFCVSCRIKRVRVTSSDGTDCCKNLCGQVEMGAFGQFRTKK